MYLGVDIHKRYAQVAVMDEDGRIRDEIRVENADLDEFAAEYAGSEVAIEATGSHRHVYDTLDNHCEVTLVNPSQTRAIAEAKTKTDSVDTKMLAHLLRTKMVPESYVPPDEIREARDLVRARKALMEDKNRVQNRVHAILARNGITTNKSLFSKAGHEFLYGLDLTEIDQAVMDAQLSVLDTLTEKIASLEELIEDRAELNQDTQLLMTMPGISYLSALTVKAEIGGIERFPGHEELVSYAGLDPTVEQSGDKETRGHISKEGSAHLRWILVQCANVAQRCTEYFGGFYERLKRRKSHDIAIVATARKMLVSIYYMLSRQEVFDPPAT